MGWWNLLTNLNNAEGTREAMKMAFDKGIQAGQGDVRAGLYQALASRWQVRGIPVNTLTQTMIWAELLPFLHLDQTMARNAIAEYVVYKERPRDAKIDWLTQVVKHGCATAKMNMAADEFNGFMLFATDHNYVWTLMLADRGHEFYWS